MQSVGTLEGHTRAVKKHGLLVVCVGASFLACPFVPGWFGAVWCEDMGPSKSVRIWALGFIVRFRSRVWSLGVKLSFFYQVRKCSQRLRGPFACFRISLDPKPKLPK